MAKISKEEVEYIAKLARISLSQKDVEKFQKELSSILDFISELDKADTKGVEPLSSVSGLKNVTRDDKITNTPNTEELLKNAPDTYRTSIRTKKVLGEGPTA